MKQLTIPPCPHCGNGKQGVYRKQQVHGWVGIYYFDYGDRESNQDSLVYGRLGPLRCIGCNHIRADVTVVFENTYEVITPIA